jgi:nucleotide-binding universal stress UspA family protein
MAYVPGCEHDVFVSYAHLDNEPIATNQAGWVDALAERLQIEVSQRLGTREFKLWIDRHLDGNHPITPEILTAIRQSATLLVVMSPGYLNSEWCRRERTAFLELVKDRVGGGGVFVVFAREVARKDIPPEFGDLEGFRFWIQDAEARADRPLGVPDPTERAYISKLLQLSHDLKKQLECLRTTGGQPRIRSQPLPDRPSVFVARSTDDLEDREDELKSYLNQAGINVLPQARYPQGSQSAFETAMREDLARCKAFVQLLSASRGRELDSLPAKRHPRLQHDIAVAAGTPRLLWRDRSLDLESVRDPEHRALLESARACGMEEFKRAVSDEALRAPEPPRASPLSVMVFVNAESHDRELAQKVGSALMQHQVECYFPLAGGSPEAIRRDLEENLGNCDGVLLIYGASGAEWVRSQLRQGRKIISQRDRPLNALAVYEGPPFTKEDLGVAIPNLVLLDCRDGFDTTKLGQFVASLRK